MRNLHCLTIVTSMVLIAAAPMCHALQMRAASAEISDMDDDKRAKLDVQEVKNRQTELEQEDQQGQGQDNGENCGTVSIGNSNGDQHGLNSVAPQSTTVIVTGDVFNTASCGR